MESPPSAQSQQIIFSEIERAKIEKYGSASKFRPGDNVYYCPSGTSLCEGPYIISSVPKAGKYILCNEVGEVVRDGSIVDEKDLVGIFQTG